MTRSSNVANPWSTFSCSGTSKINICLLLQIPAAAKIYFVIQVDVIEVFISLFSSNLFYCLSTRLILDKNNSHCYNAQQLWATKKSAVKGHRKGDGIADNMDTLKGDVPSSHLFNNVYTVGCRGACTARGQIPGHSGRSH